MRCATRTPVVDPPSIARTEGAPVRAAPCWRWTTVLVLGLGLGCRQRAGEIARTSAPPEAKIEHGTAPAPDTERPIDGDAAIEVTDATPPSGNGPVVVESIERLPLPGRRGTMVAVRGASGEVRHDITIQVDSSGRVLGVVHGWSTPDGASAVNNACGGQAAPPCAAVRSDPTTGQIEFEGVTLSGLDVHTRTPSTSVLRGSLP